MSALDHAAAHERIADLALETSALERLADSADPDDAALREHLAQCERCTAEVAAWLDVHDSIGAALAGADAHDVARIAAPAALRDRVLERIATPAREAQAGRRPRPWRYLRPGRAIWRSALALAAVVALLVVGGVGAALVRDQQAQIETAQSGSRALANALATANRVLADPDHWAVPLAAPAGGAGSGTLAWTRHDLVVLASGLPAPPAGQVYLCWLASSAAGAGEPDGLTRVGYMHYIEGQAFWASSLDGWAQIDLVPGSRFVVTLATAHSDDTGTTVLEGAL
jgi:hypothetical protein